LQALGFPIQNSELWLYLNLVGSRCNPTRPGASRTGMREAHHLEIQTGHDFSSRHFVIAFCLLIFRAGRISF
jgi:hypothetical protein